MRLSIYSVLLGGAVIALPSTALADPVTYAEALTRAAANAPSLKARAASTDAAR